MSSLTTFQCIAEFHVRRWTAAVSCHASHLACLMVGCSDWVCCMGRQVLQDIWEVCREACSPCRGCSAQGLAESWWPCVFWSAILFGQGHFADAVRTVGFVAVMGVTASEGIGYRALGGSGDDRGKFSAGRRCNAVTLFPPTGGS